MNHEEQADKIVDMFRPYSWSNGDSRQEEFDSETKNATECAIKHVDGLIKLCHKAMDSSSEFTETDDFLTKKHKNFISVRAVLEGRIKNV